MGDTRHFVYLPNDSGPPDGLDLTVIEGLVTLTADEFNDVSGALHAALFSDDPADLAVRSKVSDAIDVMVRVAKEPRP